MKKFKTIDFYISVVLIVFFVILSLIKMKSTFFVGYFVVGAWQVISMIIHVIKKWFIQRGGVRYVYHWITLVAVLTMPIGSFWILLFIAPFMAVFYAWICYKEVFVKMVRPLDQLK